MVPLERLEREPEVRRGLPFRMPPAETPRPEKQAEPKLPRRFKVVDVMTREVLAEGADARATVELLKTVRSVVDVTVYDWEPKAGVWRALTIGERKALWAFRDR